MSRIILFATALGAAVVCGLAPAADTKVPANQVLEGTNGVRLVVRAQGPYDADVPLQVVCYFKHKKAGDRTLGAAAELDKRLGGVIASLRNRSEFAGDEQETLLLTPPRGTIKPRLLLLVGLGDEGSLALGTMERAGQTALRQAARLGVKRVAFAPLLRDQGNDKLAVGAVETAVIRGVLLAYDTDRRLQKEGLAKDYTLEEWVVEAGPAYYDETVAGVRSAIAQAADAVKARDPKAYSTKSKGPTEGDRSR
jgi:hypothetical protein